MSQSKNTTNATSIPTTAWNQISNQTKMACAAREARATDDNTLQFKVTSLPYRYVRIEYVASSDLYTVTHFRVKRSDYSQITIASLEGVYADMLSELVYQMVHEGGRA